MSNNKSVITQEQAEAIEELTSYETWENNGEILERHAEGPWYADHRKPLNSLSVMEMASILYEGFEVEKPIIELPEQVNNAKINQLINDYKEWEKASVFSYEDGVGDGVKLTLNNLGIEVKGINA